jgi:ER-bound oxygenase mpaB/B'/Rubber oxygenase, catalytic domain
MSRPPFTDDYLASLRACGDPEGDAVVADFVAEVGDANPKLLVQELIQHQRTLPPERQVPSVREYFARAAPLPAWADADVLRHGQEVFSVFGVHIASALFCASLPMSYTAVDGTQVLLRTAELVSHTRRRVAQTGEMLLDVMGANDPPGTPPFAADAPSYRAPHGVRLFHAAVRHMLRNDPGYDREALGEPINQEDLLGTLVAFTVVVIEALERFGVPLAAEQRDAYVRLWLTAGVLLGITPESLESRRQDGPLAIGWEELVALRDAIARRQAGASTAGRVLMAALLAEQSEAMPFPLKALPRSCTRYLIGDEYCDYLAVPAAGWTGLLLRPLPVVNRVLFGRVYYDLAGWLSAKVTRRLYRAWIARAAGPGPHPWRYEPVVRSWKLEPAPTRALRVARHPVRAHRDRRALRTAFAIR